MWPINAALPVLRPWRWVLGPILATGLYLRSGPDHAEEGGRATPFQLELRNHLGVQYSAPVTLGNQTLRAVYDTGSFEILAMSSQCSACQTSLSLYNNESSATFEGSHGPPETHRYVGGSMLARQGFEAVRIGGPNSPIAASRVAFWQVLGTTMSVWRKEGKADFSVIVGMGHPAQVSTGIQSLLEEVHAQRFAICLQRGPANPGWLTVNPELDLGPNTPFRTVPVVGQHHWAMHLTGVRLAEGMANPCNQSCVAIVDSGTSMLAAPPRALLLMWDVIQSIQYNCSNLGELPDLVFELGDYTFAMPPSAYVMQIARNPVDPSKPASCIPAFMDLNMTDPELGEVWVLGMPFLRHFYTVFDREGPRLHIAEQGEGCQPAPAQTLGLSLAWAGKVRAAELTLADPEWALRPLERLALQGGAASAVL